MPTTTPNFGWSVPVSTDLVKDGATAIELLGDSIDTTLVDLKGGTTGQVLAKNSGTDMDFIWSSPNPGDITEVAAGTGISGGGTSGAVTITNSMATEIDAKGDLIAGTGADTFSRLAVGSNDQVLTADSTTATGLKWSAVSGGGMTSLASGSLSTGSGTLSLTSISGAYKNLQLVIRDWYPSTNGVGINFTCNAVTDYDYVSMFAVTDNSTANSDTQIANTTVAPYYNAVKNSDGNNVFLLDILDYANTSSVKAFSCIARYIQQNNSIGQIANTTGSINTASAITSIAFNLSSGNFAQGTYELFGVK